MLIPRPGFVGEVGEVSPLRVGEFLPTLSGTMGLMRSLCISMSRVSASAGAVSASSADDASRPTYSAVGDNCFRGNCKGLLEWSSFSGGAI